MKHPKDEEVEKVVPYLVDNSICDGNKKRTTAADSEEASADGGHKAGGKAG